MLWTVDNGGELGIVTFDSTVPSPETLIASLNSQLREVLEAGKDDTIGWASRFVNRFTLPRGRYILYWRAFNNIDTTVFQNPASLFAAIKVNGQLYARTGDGTFLASTRNTTEITASLTGFSAGDIVNCDSYTYIWNANSGLNSPLLKKNFSSFFYQDFLYGSNASVSGIWPVNCDGKPSNVVKPQPHYVSFALTLDTATSASVAFYDVTKVFPNSGAENKHCIDPLTKMVTPLVGQCTCEQARYGRNILSIIAFCCVDVQSCYKMLDDAISYPTWSDKASLWFLNRTVIRVSTINLDTIDELGRTLLISAILGNKLETAKRLLQLNANPLALENDTNAAFKVGTPLWAAVSQHSFVKDNSTDRLNLIKSLLAAGANPNIYGPDNMTPFQIAFAESDDIELISIFLDAKAPAIQANVNMLDKNLAATPLMSLVCKSATMQLVTPLWLRSCSRFDNSIVNSESKKLLDYLTRKRIKGPGGCRIRVGPSDVPMGMMNFARIGYASMCQIQVAARFNSTINVGDNLRRFQVAISVRSVLPTDAAVQIEFFPGTKFPQILFFGQRNATTPQMITIDHLRTAPFPTRLGFSRVISPAGGSECRCPLVTTSVAVVV